LLRNISTGGEIGTLQFQRHGTPPRGHDKNQAAPARQNSTLSNSGMKWRRKLNFHDDPHDSFWLASAPLPWRKPASRKYLHAHYTDFLQGEIPSRGEL